MPPRPSAPKPFPEPLPAPPPPLPFPNDPRLMKEQILLRERLEFEVYRPWLRSPRVRILMVTDGEGMFNTSHRFGLGHIVEILADDPWWWVHFDVTTAHRDDVPVGLTSATRGLAAYAGRAASPGKAALPAKTLHFNARFAGDPRPELALGNFDEVWLFGIAGAASRAPRRPRSRLSGLSWTRGGGVLAMGDHSALGAALCSEIPRVKHMRKWKPGGPAGDPPPALGADRIDTLRAGPTPGFQFPDQSDTVPQVITPKRYYSALGSTVFRRRWHPHPVLCGIDGVIDVLPDHMHEGECVVAPALPPGDFPGGVAPEVIATGEVLPHTTDNSSEGFGVDVTSTARTFGILGAYDGHDPAANVGRIVVDATWHHWVHINLVGFVTSAPGSAEFAKIRNYYWNVALWLAPRPVQSAMFGAAVYGLPWLQPFDELRADRDLDVYWLGIEAMDAIGRRAGQCVVTEWLDRLFIEFQIPHKSNRPDPPPDEEILQRFGAAMLGGMVERAMALAADPAREKHTEARIGKALREGALAGFRHNLERERTRQKARGTLLARLERAEEATKGR